MKRFLLRGHGFAMVRAVCSLKPYKNQLQVVHGNCRIKAAAFSLPADGHARNSGPTHLPDAHRERGRRFIWNQPAAPMSKNEL